MPAVAGLVLECVICNYSFGGEVHSLVWNDTMHIAFSSLRANRIFLKLSVFDREKYVLIYW